MKIAFIVSEFPSVSQTFVLNQITGILDCGHEIDIFARWAGGTSELHDDVIKYNLLNRTYYFLSIPQNKIIRFLKALIMFCRYFPFDPISLLKSLNFVKNRKEAASLYLLFHTIPLLKKGPYDIIQCHFGSNGNLAVLLKEAGIITGKIVTAFHGYDLTSYLKKMGPEIYEKLFEKGDLFLPISDRWKNTLIQLGCRKEKITVHRMGVDVDKILFSKQYRQNSQPIKILSVGRLVEKKGFRYGIQAIEKLTKKFLNIEYSIVGDGPLKKDLRNQINELNLKSKIKLMGYMKQEQIFNLMSEADIFLAPSVTGVAGDQEGIPVVLMEAMAHGLPVISTCHSGIPELVKNDYNGFLVDEGDVKAIVEKIEYLVCNSQQANEISIRGRQLLKKTMLLKN